MSFNRHGATWANGTSDLEVEMYCIRKGGRWKIGQKECGEGLSFHYERMRQILWPELVSHRWHELCRDTILTSNVTVLMGPKSCGKTHEASWMYLCEYFCFPDETCVLVSSTDLQGLRLRVWGEINDLWSKAVNKFPELPGNLVDSKMLIATDNLAENEIDEQRMARDWRKGIKAIATVSGGRFVGLSKWVGIKQKRMRLIADEACFVAGSPVNTPHGEVPIASIRPGDVISNCLGSARVKHVSRTIRSHLVKIKGRDGREIICTRTHPFFTQHGWVCACDLKPSHYLISGYESVQLLRENVSASQQQQGVRCVSRSESQGDMQAVRVGLQEAPPQIDREVLQSILQFEMAPFSARSPGEVLHAGARPENIGWSQEVLRRESRPEREGGCAVASVESNAEPGVGGENESQPSKDWARSENSRRKWDRSNQSGVAIGEFNSRPSVECDRENRDASRLWLSPALQARSGDSGIEVRSRSGRVIASRLGTDGAGRKENGIARGTWVDSCSFLEQSNIQRLGGGPNGVEVFNLEVEGHPSYCVNGLLVHNSMMGPSFLDAFANLDGNEDFRAVILGNPADPTDPLGRAAEPKDGWSSHMEPSKTTVWTTRFMNGKCVNLVGTDSPNFDYPDTEPTKYKYLISREKIANTLSFFPKDSYQYYSQCVGVMKIGVLARRVINRDMCFQFDATKDVVWKENDLTRVCALDAAYSGDRCVLGYADFGKDLNGDTLINIYPPVIIPVMVRQDLIAEDQIATFLRNYAQENNIKPENFFHDSTGRGSLGTSLARIWSNLCNPVEFGGRPTKRPVSLDLLIDDPETGLRRHKRCDEHYDRFVSELAFSVRYVIEGRQMRNLPSEVMDELCDRKWDLVKGDKISIEPKSGTITRPGYKERHQGQSPDLADMLCILIEGARQRGFEIKKLGGAREEESGDDFFKLEAERYAKAIKSNLLQHV